jgi:hypothetical protein
MSKTGTDAATGTTQLRAIMVSLLKPSEQANTALTELGLTQQGLRDTIMEDGLWSALLVLNDAVDGNTAKWAELFPNVRALAGIMDLLGPQLEGNIELMNGMAQSAGVASEAFSLFTESAQADVDRLPHSRNVLPFFKANIRSVFGLLSARTGQCALRRVRTGLRSRTTWKG